MAKVLLFLSLFGELPSQDQSPAYLSHKPGCSTFKDLFWSLHIYALPQPFIATVTAEEKTRLRRLLCGISVVVDVAIRLGYVL
jgi:hypothetical protein